MYLSLPVFGLCHKDLLICSWLLGVSPEVRNPFIGVLQEGLLQENTGMWESTSRKEPSLCHLVWPVLAFLQLPHPDLGMRSPVGLCCAGVELVLSIPLVMNGSLECEALECKACVGEAHSSTDAAQHPLYAGGVIMSLSSPPTSTGQESRDMGSTESSGYI